MIKASFGFTSICMMSVVGLFQPVCADSANNLVTIATVGATHSLTNIHQKPLPKLNVHDQAHLKQIAQAQADKAIAGMYHVSTPSMQVGYVQSHHIKEIKGFEHPFAIVGCDAKSMQWLSHYADRLNQLQSSVYIVNCDSKTTYEQIKQLIKGQVLAVPGQEFAQQFHIKHYPFLVTHNMISQ